MFEAKAIIQNGPLLDEPAAVKQPKKLETMTIPLIPRKNPFLKPVQAWLRDFKTFQPSSIISVSGAIFRAPLRPDVMHRVVTWHRAGLRQGTHSSKARGEVAGSRRKIRPQKGTGKARVGNSRAPQRKGGGRCFGPKPRDYYFSLPPKIRSLGLRSALSAKFSAGRLSFVHDDSITMGSHKTAQLLSCLENISTHTAARMKKVLLIDSEPLNENLKRASQSLCDRFKFMNVQTDMVNVYHVLDSSYVVLTERAAEYLKNWLEKDL